jgi:hypothetical protein
MRIYQLERKILKDESQELSEAIAVADACTHRFQAKKKRYDTPITSDGDKNVYEVL